MASTSHLVVTGKDMVPWLDAVARLRIAVFRDYPYLYDGDLDYEQAYLEAYAKTPDSVLVMVLDGDQVVGASTGLPLASADPVFHVPFNERDLAIDSVFYCGESVLLPAYRGQGWGHRFFDEREAHARTLPGLRWITFAAVERGEDDPRKPLGYRGNDSFWTGRGYVRQPDMQSRLAWKELGRTVESEQTLTFWMRALERSA